VKNSLLFLTLGLLLLLASCGTPEAASTPTPIPTPTPDPAKETGVLVQGYIDAYHALDADKFMSYFADDATYFDTALKDIGVYTRAALDRSVHSTFSAAISAEGKGFKVEINSFFVSPDGKFAALEGTYYDFNKFGRQVPMPMVIILEFRDGKIIRETDYYDRGPVK
jgi:ketosteroid isomerase-like protein